MDITREYYDSSKLPHPAIAEFFALIQYWDLVVQFVSRSIKTRYKRSVLGVFWTMLNPLMTMVVLTLVFSNVFRFPIQNYPVYILSGLTIWNFFSAASKQAMGEMFYSGGLLNRIYIPKSVFVVSAVATGMVNLGLSFVVLLGIALILGVQVNFTLLVLPISILIATLFTFGIGLVLATAAVYFSDIMPFYDVILMVWFYATPVFYPADIIPAQWAWVFKLNPMVYIVDIFRQPIFQGTIPSLHQWVIALAVSLVAFFIGWYLFTIKSNEYAYRI
ncbi:MAG: ABC transporter permease [Chloroflexi bacterium]|nr:ABC transporter permease [Chloroflexota bacterium]